MYCDGAESAFHRARRQRRRWWGSWRLKFGPGGTRPARTASVVPGNVSDPEHAA